MPAVVAVLAVIEGADLPEHVLALLDHLLDLAAPTAIRARAMPIRVLAR